MVKFNFGLGGSNDDKKDDGQTPQTDDGTTNPVVSDPPVLIDENDSNPVLIDENDSNPEIKIDETKSEITVEKTPVDNENTATSTTEENPTETISKSPTANESIETVAPTEDNLKKNVSEDTTENNQTDLLEPTTPFSVDTDEKSDPFALANSQSDANPVIENNEKPFGDLANNDESQSSVEEHLAKNKDDNEIKPEDNPFSVDTEKTPLETPVDNDNISETSLEDTFGANTSNSSATDPAQTLSKLKEELQNFLDTKNERITELNKEISERKKEIKDEEKAIADKQKELSTILGDIQGLTESFGKKKKSGKNAK